MEAGKVSFGSKVNGIKLSVQSGKLPDDQVAGSGMQADAHGSAELPTC